MAQLDVPVVVRMSEDMHREVQERAEAEDRSAAWIVRKAVSDFLSAPQPA